MFALRSTSLAWVPLLVGCGLAGCGRDFGIVQRDAGMWVPPPAFDAGPRPPLETVVCVGTPVPCDARERDDCAFGCIAGACTGRPSACSWFSSQSECERREGCTWYRERYFDECDGDPRPCDTHSDRMMCEAQGCGWALTTCQGAPYPCESMQARYCTDVPGCRLLNPPDGGPVDGGPVDAGPWCSTPGACDPFVARSCGVGRLCVATEDATGTRCVSAASSLRGEGSSCTSSNQCAEGLDCVTRGSTTRCYRRCRPDSLRTCGADSRCWITGFDRAGCVDYCLNIGPPCDVVRQDCASGFACYSYWDDELVAVSSLCATTGTAPVGAACTALNDCVRGASCIDRLCRRVCNTTADCTSGTCAGTVPETPWLRYCL